MAKILVIEDETPIRENILELLDAEGFDTIGAENGQIGLKLAQQEIPDLILSDALMPELDGYGLLTALRSDTVTATIPFIFLTAKAAKTDMRQGMELGADDYLTKPFTADELLGAIAARLEKQAAIDRKSQKKLDDLRSNITTTLPHELHTPLNGILACSQLLIDEANSIGAEEIMELAEDINTSAERLYKLVQNFLLYAQLELIATDTKEIEALRRSKTDSSSSAIADAALKRAKLSAREGDLKLDLQESAIAISSKNLQKIVEELIDNACKFSPQGSSIAVTSSCDDNDNFVLCVSDKGKGMEPSQIYQIGAYMRFERKLSSQQGAGLGLTIVKRLAELHGGELTIESVPGIETVVRVTLPIFDSIKRSG